jgi:hypothetical protein
MGYFVVVEEIGAFQSGAQHKVEEETRWAQHESENQTGYQKDVSDVVASGIAQNKPTRHEVEREVMYPAYQNGFAFCKERHDSVQAPEALQVPHAERSEYEIGVDRRQECNDDSQHNSVRPFPSGSNDEKEPANEGQIA